MPAADGATDHVREAERLGDLVNGHPEHADDALPKLVAIFAKSDAPRVTQAVVDALSHAWDPRAAAAVLDNVLLHHPDAGVRLAVAQALPNGLADESGDLFDRVVDALTGLTRDAEPRVRDWAAFGLGQIEARTPQALDALAALLDDADEDTRSEALLALATAGDQRALPVLRRRLDAEDPIDRLELRAAVAMAEPELHTELVRLAESWAGDEDELTDLVAAAVARSAPGAAGAAQHVEKEVLEQVLHLVSVAAQVTLTGAYPRTVLAISDEAERLDLPLWADGERPDRYPTDDVLNAVRGSMTQPTA